MDLNTIRHALVDFAGQDKAKRFILCGIGPQGRLHYWQQKLWDAFIEAHPIFADATKSLPEIVRFCVLHNRELLQTSLEVFHGNLDYTSEFNHDRITNFLFAAIAPWSTEGAPFEGNSVTVWFCPMCQDVYEKSRWAR